MLIEYLNPNNVRFNVDIDNPIEAIRFAGQLLVDTQKVKESYIEEMIDVYKTLGPYIVIAPGIAFPHSKPSDSVLKKGLSFCKLKKPIPFNHPQNDPVEFVFALCGTEGTDHLDMLSELSQFLMDESNLGALKTINDENDFFEFLEKGGEK